MALITCQNVKVGYEGRTVAENINFSVEKGDYLFHLLVNVLWKR